MLRRKISVALTTLLMVGLVHPRPVVGQLRVGSKKFTESVILGELVTLLARSTGIEAQHQQQLGGTRVLWNALRGGELDI